MQTRITELLGISCPIICAGMSAVATPELAAAVSHAGGGSVANTDAW
jgi:enoyl-[acyl-carrier protein] reductase II